MQGRSLPIALTAKWATRLEYAPNMDRQELIENEDRKGRIAGILGRDTGVE